MATDNEALPPLPQPQFISNEAGAYWGYSAEQMVEFRREGISAALAQRQQVPEQRVWLVEWRFNGVQWLYLWPSAPGGFSFTSNASKALRFARREDAEAALQWARDTDAARRPIGSLTRHGLALGEMLVTEHDWPALTAAPSTLAEPPKDIQQAMAPSRFALYARDQPAAQAEPVAWMHPDGRVVPAATKAAAERDGGAMRSSLSGYTIPLAEMRTAQAEPQAPSFNVKSECTWSLVSSRVCQRGSMGCNVDHALAQAEPHECNDNDSPWLICKPCAAAGQCAKAAQAEPVAYVDHADGRVIWKGKRLPGGALLYAAPPAAQAGLQGLVALQLLRDELPHAEWEDKHIHPVGAESFQNWRISIRLPVPLSEADKSPEAALNRLLKGKT